MKKAKSKLGKIIGKVIGGVLLANIALFLVFFFDLDGKLLFNVVEPGLKKHYDNMERKENNEIFWRLRCRLHLHESGNT